MAKDHFNCIHGHASSDGRTPEYAIWQAMNARCRNPKNPRYESYGGRGIAICEAWRDFAKFFADMGARPTPQHQLDRRDNDKGYNPDNCRWATPAEQMVNRRNTRFVEVDGKQMPLATLAHFCGIPANTLRARILAGWDVPKATSTPVGPSGPKPKATRSHQTSH